MLMTMMMIMLTTVTFMFMKHPLSMGIMLIIQTVMISIMVGMVIKSFWFSYMLVLIMLSGVLVLFIYMASIASNEKFYSSVILNKMVIIYMISTLVITYLADSIYNNNINTEKVMMFMENEQTMDLMKMFNYQNMQMTLMMVLYLLFTMIVVVYNTNIYEGPMRSKN